MIMADVIWMNIINSECISNKRCWKNSSILNAAAYANNYPGIFPLHINDQSKVVWQLNCSYNRDLSVEWFWKLKCYCITKHKAIHLFTGILLFFQDYNGNVSYIAALGKYFFSITKVCQNANDFANDK